jgi:tetratricopeptide (TPR) repeat protein
MNPRHLRSSTRLRVFLICGVFSTAVTAKDESWLEREYREFRTFSLLDHAFRMIEQNRLPEARKELERCVHIAPKDEKAWLTYLSLLFRQADYAEVTAQAGQALRQGVSSPRIYLYRAQAELKLGQKQAALKDFQAVTAQAGVSGEDAHTAQASIVDLALAGKNYAAAQTALVSLPPEHDDFRWAFARGLTAQGLGQTDSAITAFKRALNLAGNDRDKLQACLAIAEEEKKRKNWAEVRASLTQAQALAGDDAALARQLAELEQIAGHPANALSWQKKVVEREPSSAADHAKLANLWFAQGRCSEAVQEFETALALSREPEQQRALYISLGHAQARLGHDIAAARAFGAATAIREDNETLMAWANALEASGQKAVEAEKLEAVLEKTPSAALHVRLGQLYAQLGQKNRAVEHWDAALHGGAVPALQRQLHRQKIDLYRNHGEYAKAIAELNALIESEPRQAPYYEMRAELHYKQGETEAAVGDLEQIGRASCRERVS